SRMSLRCAIAVITLAACGGKPPPPPPVVKTEAPPPKLAPAAPACIKPLEDETVAITHAVVDGTLVKYCIGGNRDQCFSMDTATGDFKKLDDLPKRDELANARVETTSPELKVCQLESCKTLTPKILPAIAQMRAATNAAGSIAVVLLGDAQAGKGYAEVWDVASTKKLARFKYARGEFKCGDVAIIEDTIFLSASQCSAPAARAALYTLKGRRIANVGGADFGVYGNAHAPVDTKQWAFLEENGNLLVVQDLVKGKILKKIDTSILFKEAGGGATMGNPGESALLRLGPGKLAVIGGAPATGHVLVVDVATGEVKLLKATICGA
ncbi:MAG TPA: hypothetical protein VFO79_15495, partial [Xanthomonadales bacterium]|nr:hypothetical protein [Xanthomonadales bacterium]